MFFRHSIGGAPGRRRLAVPTSAGVAVAALAGGLLALGHVGGAAAAVPPAAGTRSAVHATPGPAAGGLPVTPALYAADLRAADAAFDPARFYRTFTSRTDTIAGVPVHSVVGGSGDVVVLLHGFPDTWFTWHKVMPLLARHHRVVAVDLPGFGASGRPRSATKQAVATYLHALLHRLHVGRATLVGHDMGVTVAYAYTRAWPKEVTHLVAVDGLVPGFGLADGSRRDPLVVTARRDLWIIPLFIAPGHAAETVTHGRERQFLHLFTDGGFVNPKAYSAEDFDATLRWAVNPRTGFSAGYDYYRAWFTDAAQNHRSFTGRLDTPVLGLGAVAGPIPTDVLPSLRQVFTHVQGGLAERTGHFVQEERPVSLTRRIDRFISTPAS